MSKQERLLDLALRLEQDDHREADSILVMEAVAYIDAAHEALEAAREVAA